MEQMNPVRGDQHKKYPTAPPILKRQNPKYEELKRNEEQKARDLHQNFIQKYIQPSSTQKSTAELLEELLELQKRNELYEATYQNLSQESQKLDITIQKLKETNRYLKRKLQEERLMLEESKSPYTFMVESTDLYGMNPEYVNPGNSYTAELQLQQEMYKLYSKDRSS